MEELDQKAAIKKALKEGYAAGYEGKSVFHCPYVTKVMRVAWLDMHRAGKEAKMHGVCSARQW